MNAIKRISIISLFCLILFTGCKEKNIEKETTTKQITTTSTTTTTTKSAEQVKKEKELFRELCKTYKYKDLYRNIEEYKNLPIKVKGKVIQVLESDDSYDIRLDMTKDKYGFWDDTIYIIVSKKNVEKRILEDDIITVYGIITGLHSYKSTIGATITLPLIYGNEAIIN